MSQLEFNWNGGTVILRQEADQVLFPVLGGGFEAAPCMWFAMCLRDAVTTMSHPVMGDVPICGECNDKVSAW